MGPAEREGWSCGWAIVVVPFPRATAVAPFPVSRGVTGVAPLPRATAVAPLPVSRGVTGVGPLPVAPLLFTLQVHVDKRSKENAVYPDDVLNRHK